MDPSQGNPPGDDDAARQRIDRATDDLQAKLSEPLPPTQIPPPASSMPSELEAIRDLALVEVTRVDQLARTMAEAYSRVSQLADQQIATMRLMQEQIARSDELQQMQGEQIDRLETTVAALVKINANLSECIAALTGTNQEQ